MKAGAKKRIAGEIAYLAEKKKGKERDRRI